VESFRRMCPDSATWETLKVVEDIDDAIPESTRDLGEDKTELTIWMMGEPPGHRVEDVTEHPRMTEQLQGSRRQIKSFSCQKVCDSSAERAGIGRD